MPINKYIISGFVLILVLGFLLQKLEKNEKVGALLQLKSLFSSDNENINPIKVKISGCIKKPGLYCLGYGKRFIDLIEEAGGLLPYAGVKLSFDSLLKDGEEYKIPYRKLRDGEKIDINRASSGLLLTLPQIGKVMAERIISYRKRYGRFNNIEDLTNISGIGKKKLELIKKFIIIGE